MLEGTWHAARGNRLVLESENAQDLGGALAVCDSRVARARVIGDRHTARIGGPCRRSTEPARRICGHERVRIGLRVFGQPVTLSIDQRYTGQRLDDGEYTPPIASRR